MNRYDLSGHVAVVTGGAQGIGLAVARRLAEAGARLALWDRDGDLAREAEVRAGTRSRDPQNASCRPESIPLARAPQRGLRVGQRRSALLLMSRG